LNLEKAPYRHQGRMQTVFKTIHQWWVAAIQGFETAPQQGEKEPKGYSDRNSFLMGAVGALTSQSVA